MKYIIEHMEPLLFKWCEIEYKNISKAVGKKNIIFTHINAKDSKKLEGCGKIYSSGIEELGLDLKRCCLLDQNAEKELLPSDAKRLDYIIFGGILGDFPRKHRTARLSGKIKCERRNLGKKQMPTDNAVLAAKMILSGKRLSEIRFQDGIEIETGKNESVSFPFRYVLIDGEPFVSKELVEYLKKRKGF